jgi:hypothetical protein
MYPLEFDSRAGVLLVGQGRCVVCAYSVLLATSRSGSSRAKVRGGCVLGSS